MYIHLFMSAVTYVNALIAAYGFVFCEVGLEEAFLALSLASVHRPKAYSAIVPRDFLVMGFNSWLVRKSLIVWRSFMTYSKRTNWE